MSSSLCKNLEGAIFPLQVEAVTSTKFSYVATNSEPLGLHRHQHHLKWTYCQARGIHHCRGLCPPKLGRKPGGLDPLGWA